MLLMVFSTISFFIFNGFLSLSGQSQKAVYASHFLIKPYQTTTVTLILYFASVMMLATEEERFFILLSNSVPECYHKYRSKTMCRWERINSRGGVDEILSHMNVALRSCLSTSFWVHLSSTCGSVLDCHRLLPHLRIGVLV
uniref:Uncharacterized protein n=2 Tax=Opuntia streptacantha TaxID=393608 RepID=A0A7C9DM63_OPUST